jgi:hypothetical protein
MGGLTLEPETVVRLMFDRVFYFWNCENNRDEELVKELRKDCAALALAAGLPLSWGERGFEELWSTLRKLRPERIYADR